MNEVMQLGGMIGISETNISAGFEYATRPTKPAKPFPRTGDTVTIKHQVKRTSTGDVLGVQRSDGKGSSARITAVYMDGTVRVGHSEVWDVKPGTQGHWETINPMHAEHK